MVIRRLALVGTKCSGITFDQHRHIADGRDGQVVASTQHGLVQEHVVIALGHDDAVDLDADFPGGREDLDAFVRILGMGAQELLVLSKPF